MIPRVAFFTDSFHEINGVAHTSRRFDAFVRQRALPFLNVHAGPRTSFTDDGPVWTLELQRSSAGFALEKDMSFDLLFFRYKRRVRDLLQRFGTDLIHITGPSDVGMLGVALAHELKLPVIASWHTNIHEFGAPRLSQSFRNLLPSVARAKLAAFSEEQILSLCVQYYRLARVFLAPNPELVALLQRRTGRPGFLMQRGVDTELFSPEKRTRDDDQLVIGYVGRLSPEKSVRALRDLEQVLVANGVKDYRFKVVGDGHESNWLRANLQQLELTGVLEGDALARAYADMDIFAFPSHTDTYGNVVLEALASGVPPVVTSSGGPKYLVADGVTGLVSATADAFAQNVLALALNSNLRKRMQIRAREFALCRYWHRIFEQVYDTYEYCLRAARPVCLSRLSATQRSPA
jgi:glycosyltransferase involved in cell wall biosynthesis